MLLSKSYNGPALQSAIKMSDLGELRLVCTSLNGQKH